MTKTEVSVFPHIGGVEITRWLRFEKRCSVTGNPHRVHVRAEDWERIRAGEHVQNVLPHYTDCQREFLITGTTPEEWKAMEAAMPEDE